MRRTSGAITVVIAVLVGVMVTVATPGAGADATGDLDGVVVDAAGTPVPGAAVEACRAHTGPCLATTTGDDGSWALEGLTPGEHTLAVAPDSGPSFPEAAFGGIAVVGGETNGNIQIAVVTAGSLGLSGGLLDDLAGADRGGYRATGTATVPDPPTNLAGVAGDSQVLVSWVAPADDGGDAITSYEISALPDGKTCQWASGPLQCVVGGLTNGVEYSFTATATNGVGESSPSAPIVVVPTECDGSGAGPFSDVPANHIFCPDIEWLAATGVTTGFVDGTFRPSIPITRAGMAAFLFRYLGDPGFVAPGAATFPDVPTDHQFFREIEWLAQSGITTGYADGLFRPAASITRGSMAAFLYRAGGEPVFTPPGTASFPDVGLSHPFFAEVEWLVSTEVTTGYLDGTYRPAFPVTRGSMAAFLHRFDDLDLV
jgi:hypothetical protein